jgi:uncharacterized protein YkwD
MAVMGCQQSDTVIRTEGTAVEPVQTPSVPFVLGPGEDHPAAQSVLATTSLPALQQVRPATVWTAQSLSLAVLPGSPTPARPVAVPEPAPAETKPAPAPQAVEFKAAAPARSTPTAAPTTTAPAPAAPAPAAPAPATPAPTAPPPAVAPPATVNAAPGAAGDLFARTNAVRGSRGVAALARDASLDSAANGWARELATSGALRHSALPQQLIGRPWSTLGENVGYGSSIAVIHDALVNSAGHLANIVGAAFTRVGIGAATDVNGRLWVVELFAG